MSVCLESNSVLPSQVGGGGKLSAETGQPPASQPTNITDHDLPKSISKLIVANSQPVHAASTTSAATVLQKVHSSVITVVNTPGPITVVKTIGGTTASHFTLVNSSVKAPATITLPITLVKNISTESAVAKTTIIDIPVISTTAINAATLPTPPPTVVVTAVSNNGTLPVAPLTEKPSGIHNVFVKKSSPAEGGGISMPDMPQSHKLLTANSFPTTNVIPNLSTGPVLKTANGQRSITTGNKVKILSNIVMAGSSGGNVAGPAGPSNVLLNKSQRYYQQKVVGNGQAKYLNKPPDKRVLYPTHKSQLKTLAGYKPQQQQQAPPTSMKALSPGAVQRTGAGLRTIPPQRPSLPNKTNYIGKHAVQAQKMKPKLRAKQPNNAMNQQQQQAAAHRPPQEQSAQMIFNQALTAQILETLSDKDSPTSSSSAASNKLMPGTINSYINAKYEPKHHPQQQHHEPIVQQQHHHHQQQHYHHHHQHQQQQQQQQQIMLNHHEQQLKEYKPQILSTLDTLSFVCQAVLLDHNYNATLPAEPTPQPQPLALQLNGNQHQQHAHQQHQQFSPVANYPNPAASAAAIKRSRTVSQTVIQRDDDVASDISEENRKMDTEGEETDTAPEAEAVVANEGNDRYGDYVTRCICGFIHDDGYMIECDGCKVWQHVRCVVKTKKVPDDYLCEACDPGKHPDRQKARALQQQWMREIQERDAKLRKEQMALTDSDSSEAETTPPAQQQQHKGRRKEPPPKRQRKRKERKMPTKRTKSKSAAAAAKGEQAGGAGGAKSDGDEKLPQLRQWIENYEEAMTNHYSPELRARLINLNSLNLVLNNDRLQYANTSICHCKVQNQAPPAHALKCLVATVSLPLHTPVVEIKGKYMLSTQHRATTRHQRPGPFLFFHRLCKEAEVCVDTRSFGNCARFVRRSCTPNAELVHYLEKNTVHLYIVTTKSVDKGQELTIRHESNDLSGTCAYVYADPSTCACLNAEYCGLYKNQRRLAEEAAATDGRKRRGRHSREQAPPTPTPTSPATSPTATCPPLHPAPPSAAEPDTTEPAPSSAAPVTAKRESIIVEPPEDIKDAKVQEEENIAPVKKEGKEEEVVKEEIKEETKEDIKPSVVKAEAAVVDVKQEAEETEVIVKEESEDEKEADVVKAEIKPEALVEVKEEKEDEEECVEPVKPAPPPPPPPPPPVTTRRASRHAQDHKESQEEAAKSAPVVSSSSEQEKKTGGKEKLSREDRKLQAIMRAIERMERQEQRKQEHQAKQAHRRESEPAANTTTTHKEEAPRAKRRKRKGRARTVSTNSRRNRLDSADSMHSSDDTLLSPPPSETSSPSKAAGLLLALANGDLSRKSPDRLMDSNSNSAHSSPETPLSSACLLVAAAVEPLEPGFKFPKTKKVLMNEWLNKTDVIQSASAISPSSLTPHLADNNYYTPAKNLTALAQAASALSDQPRTGSAKKRWLRQAISEDQCDSPPPHCDPVAPPKKRRLPRESLDASPPTTPTSVFPPPVVIAAPQQPQVEIVTHQEGDSPTHMESEATLNELATEMRQEYGTCISLPAAQEAPSTPATEPTLTATPIASAEAPMEDATPEEQPLQHILTTAPSCIIEQHPPPQQQHQQPLTTRGLDPRLARFTTSEQLVGTVEKTLSFLGFEDTKKPEAITPAKRKLSITEYRQRKKLNNNEKSFTDDISITEESNSSQSPKLPRTRSNSSSSVTSGASTDEDVASTTTIVPEVKALSAFNSEPTELERQRESGSLRLKKAFGLSVDEDARKNTPINVEIILKGNLPLSAPMKSTLPLPSPTFPIPGSAETQNNQQLQQHHKEPPPVAAPPIAPPPSAAYRLTASPVRVVEPEVPMEEDQFSEEEEEEVDEEEEEEDEPVAVDDDCDDEEDVGKAAPTGSSFYTPDDEEMTESSSSYVPPFDNPNASSYTTYGSVIDDDVPYEGRNPSPPPDLSRVP